MKSIYFIIPGRDLRCISTYPRLDSIHTYYTANVDDTAEKYNETRSHARSLSADVPRHIARNFLLLIIVRYLVIFDTQYVMG